MKKKNEFIADSYVFPTFLNFREIHPMPEMHIVKKAAMHSGVLKHWEWKVTQSALTLSLTL